MGRYPCISILWGKCCDLFTKNNRATDCAPPPVELSEVYHECVQAIEEEDPILDPPVGVIITNTLTRHPAMVWPYSFRVPAIEIGLRRLPDLPSDIITNILARLPAKCIFHLWQTNSKDLLYQLTMNPQFTRNNLDRGRASLTIVVESRRTSDGNAMKLFFSSGSEAAGDVKATRLDLSLCNAYCKGAIVLYGSYDGFLLFLCEFTVELLCIWNPITKEQVIVTAKQNSGITISGFYYHPLNKEYEVICVRRLGGKKKIWEFQILGLTTRRRRSVGSYSYGPSRIKPMPVFVKGTFYWWVDAPMYFVFNRVNPSLSNSILSFNTKTQEFGTIEAVESSNNPLRPEEVFELFELEGDLCLFDPSSRADVAFLWALNYKTKRWVKKHSITSPRFHYNHGNFYKRFTEIEYNKMKGECIVYDHYNQSPPYVYNLLSGVWKPFEMTGFEDSIRTKMAIHTQSIVSLDAADSVIPVEW